jgi:hypothetical protein
MNMMNLIPPALAITLLATVLLQVVVPIATLALAYRCFRELKEIRSQLPPAR